MDAKTLSSETSTASTGLRWEGFEAAIYAFPGLGQGSTTEAAAKQRLDQASFVDENDTASRSTISNEISQQGRAISGLPSIDFRSLRDPVFTDVIRKILLRVWATVCSKALNTRFPLAEPFVAVFKDPTTEESKAVLHVTCHATAVQAFAFWKSLEKDFQSILAALKGNDKETFRRKFDFRIHWR